MPTRLTGMTSGIDTDALVSQLMEAQKTKLTKITNKQTKLEWKQDKWKDLNTKIYSLYTGTLSKLRFQSTYNQKKIASSNESKVTATGGNNLANGTHTLQIKQLASAQYTTGAAIEDTFGDKVNASTTKLTDIGYSEGDTFTFTMGDPDGDNYKEVTLTVGADTTIDDFLSSAKEAGINATFDKNHGRIFMASGESGLDHAFTVTTDSEEGMELLGLGEKATGVAAQNAIYTYNGTEFEGSSNEVSVNGLNLVLSGVTEGYGTAGAETISLNVSTDVDAVYDTIKSFVTEYNDLLKELNGAYNGATAKGYEPLTDDQKEAMTDDQIEKWENKIKDSLLRRDTTLNNLLSGFKSALQSSVEVGESKYSLASFGIMTSADYTENGLLHIYGDIEDSTYGDKADKLKAALLDDPDSTMQALTKIFGNLYSTMQDKMKSTSLSSALTFYNDKEMSKLQTSYAKEYSTMEDKLNDIEEKYYKQFSQMETSLNKLQSQQNQMASMLGLS